jgi:tetratricopeptide (TPR) repeat protein
VIESVDEVALTELEEVELLLVEYQGNGTQRLLDEAEAELANLAAVERRNRQYAARLRALEAELARLRGDEQRASELAGEAIDLWATDEVALLVQATLVDSPEASLELLSAALEEADSRNRLLAERGSVLLELGRIGDALASFDEALARLPDEYQAVYGDERERAWTLRDAERLSDASADYLNTDELSFIGMTVLTQAESTLLDFLTGGRVWDPPRLFAAMTEAGLFLPDAPGPAGITSRRDAAFLLWQLLAAELGQEELLTRYSERFAGRAGARSPVPDVQIDDPWFDAVLGLVEREIMELPDGQRFFPDEIITGLDFYAWLQATEEY